MTYLSNVAITADKKNSHSYGKAVTAEYHYAVVGGDWITLFDELGAKKFKMKISAKHFHDYDGIEITERTFKMRTKKARLSLEAYNKEVAAMAEKIKAEEAELFQRTRSRSGNTRRNAKTQLKQKYTSKIEAAALIRLDIY